MKKLTLAVLAAASVLATGVQAAGFDGVYVGLDLGVSNGELKTGTTEFGTMSGSQTNFGAKIGYGTIVSGNFYLGAEAMLRNGAGDFGDKTATISGQSIKASEKTENTRVFSFIPGYIINPNFMVYGRVGRGDADVSAKAMNTNTGAAASITGASGSFNLFGAGVSYMMTKNASATAELNRAIADDATMTNFNLGVNYRF